MGNLALVKEELKPHLHKMVEMNENNEDSDEYSATHVRPILLRAKAKLNEDKQSELLQWIVKESMTITLADEDDTELKEMLTGAIANSVGDVFKMKKAEKAPTILFISEEGPVRTLKPAEKQISIGDKKYQVYEEDESFESLAEFFTGG